MSRKTKETPVPEMIRVTVLVAFNGMYAGDVGYVLDGEMLRGWERAGLVRVEHGEDPAR